MGIHSRWTSFSAAIGVLALCGVSTARAQDTSAAARRPDTSGYGGYQNKTDTAQAGQRNAPTDSSGFKYTGPPTDTTLKAKPGAQTGPTAGDSGTAARTNRAGRADTVACKDGSNTAKGASAKKACAAHGGVDWAATKAAMKARGAGARTGADTGQVKKAGKEGYHYTGAPSDTVLKAKPGTQTGADTGAAGKADTGASSQHQSP
jgi:hypothetical protein